MPPQNRPFDQTEQKGYGTNTEWALGGWRYGTVAAPLELRLRVLDRHAADLVRKQFHRRGVNVIGVRVKD